MEIKIYIEYNENIFDVSDVCIGEVILQRTINEASVLKFNVAKPFNSIKEFSFFEGDSVWLKYNDKFIFHGYVFSKERDKNQIISVMCYDQLRYLKNKDNYYVYYKKASDVIKKICTDYKIETGIIDDTAFIINKQNFQGKSLIQIILSCLDITKQNNAKNYTIYDDAGKLCVRDVKNLVMPLLLADTTSMIDYNYKTEIDSDTYNKVKLWRKNKKTKIDSITVAENSQAQKKWGVLQYFKRINSDYNSKQAKLLAEEILSQKCRERKKLNIICMGTDNGEIDIRGGSTVYIKINNLAELSVDSMLLTENCIHRFSDNEHILELTFSEVYNGTFKYY